MPAHETAALCAATAHRDLLTNRTPEMHQWALEQFRTFRNDGQFVPFGLGKIRLCFPASMAGQNGAGRQPIPRQAFSTSTPTTLRGPAPGGEQSCRSRETVPRRSTSISARLPRREYGRFSPCNSFSGCESVTDCQRPKSPTTIKNGKGRMPGFSNLHDDQISMLVVLRHGAASNPSENKEVTSAGPPLPTQYHFTGYHSFSTRTGIQPLRRLGER